MTGILAQIDCPECARSLRLYQDDQTHGITHEDPPCPFWKKIPLNKIMRLVE